ncbi:phage major capsid protein [Meiothermus granaticius]|uniref:Phage major capsid protein, HK97 family n=1 Tax=Meiothermus granaticius NBRC 107808 TaxID=1227551 RepID=A0A399FDW8_9DEIN|nr:phage major capsid protein [Meiothermus granaticius]RIH93995.1 phage major capsid protein, HK97 family [Meiothermus granaticius NBRC 107808]GEM88176.1 phage capsid protein [Meiothermus granaticius NBRC 107808]
MPVNQIITRTDAGDGIIPQEYANEIFKAAPESSVVMRFGRQAQTLSRKQKNVPVESVLPLAYFVSGDTGLKQTSKMQWANKQLVAEELAVIIPIPEAVLDDADYDLWGEVRPKIAEAFGRAFDRAVLFGENAPGTWPTAIVPDATAKGKAVVTGGDLYADLLGENGVIALVERSGYLPNGHVAQMVMRGKLRGLRSTQGEPIFTTSLQAPNTYELDGAPLIFPRNGALTGKVSGAGADEPLLITGDWSQLVWAFRQDITYKILDQAVISDSNGAVVLNLAQQDAVALRAVLRIAWQLPNPINALDSSANRYPFSALFAEAQS